MMKCSKFVILVMSLNAGFSGGFSEVGVKTAGSSFFISTGWPV